MIILSGKKQCDIDRIEFQKRIGNYSVIHADVGTGTGKFILKSAIKDPGRLFIGIDSCAENMHESSVRVVKAFKKKADKNVIYVVSAIENLPQELIGIADSISVILPWGSLRNGIVKGEVSILNNLRALGKVGSSMHIIVGYDEENESNEIRKNTLPVLSVKHFESLKPLYHENCIFMHSIKKIGNNELKQIDSDWAKRLAYGTNREIYYLDCTFI